MEEIIKNELDIISNMHKKGILTNRLKNIKYKKFRNFYEDSELNFEFPLTILVGKNGSGKTTVMKSINILGKSQKPQYEFFETETDNSGVIDALLEYKIDNENIFYTRISKNNWGFNKELENKLNIKYIQPKSIIGAIEKSFLYDSQGKNSKKELKVQYVIKQSKKIKQNKLEKSVRKKEYNFSEKALKNINYILNKNIKEIKLLEHKYYSGTWGISVIFKEEDKEYSEYNAGNGEFLVALMVNEILNTPSDSILLIDEPEISLHPGAQKRFIITLLKLIKERKLQVILGTHSNYIIENFSEETIKCFRNMENKIYIEENTNYKYAFLELELEIKNKKRIIVEDKLAQEIIQKIIEDKKLDKFLEVNFYSGGADNLKTHIIFPYSKTDIKNNYIIFDGDQKFKEVPDFSEILEKNKTVEYYQNEFKQIVGINSDKITWGIDGNIKEGRINIENKLNLIEKYLKFYKTNVYFLPKKIPEDLIFDREYLALLGYDGVEYETNNKSNLKKTAEKYNIKLESLQDVLIAKFINKKDENYIKIVSYLQEILR